MTQILNIFKKDTRQFWLEILLSVVVTIAFVLIYPNEWKTRQDQQRHILEFSAIVAFLLVAGWWLLIARVVHAETLIGDRQFWITRPYEWKKLLAAKILFLAVWIGVPFLLAQCCLLLEAGFHPISYTPGLLYNLAELLVTLLLPVFALAAVTSTFARLTLTFLGGFIAFVGTSYMDSTIHAGNSISIPYPNVFVFPVLLGGCVVAIVLQYATRRTWLARGVLIAVPILLALSVGAYRRQSLADGAYPQPSAGSAAALIISSAPTESRPIQARTWNKEIFIDLPVQYSGVADGYAIFSDNIKFTIMAADGSEWTSPWEVNRDRIRPGTQYNEIHLELSPTVYERFKSGPVTLHITYALSRY